MKMKKLSFSLNPNFQILGSNFWKKSELKLKQNNHFDLEIYSPPLNLIIEDRLPLPM